MKTIVVSSVKGGCGKTTIAFNLAVELGRSGKQQVCLLDTDPLKSSVRLKMMRQSGNRDDMTIITPSTQDIDREIPKLQTQNFDYIVVDVGAGDNKITRTAYLASDLILIPSQPTVLDLFGVTDTMEIINKAQAVTDKKIISRVVLSMVNKAHKTMLREVEEALANKDFPPLMNTRLHNWAAVRMASALGISPGDLQGKQRNPKAAAEFKALTEEVLHLIND